MTLNIPETRQDILMSRLRNGQQVVATDAAAEFGVSVDTIRRDIIALEDAGFAHRVRGGALPVARPSAPFPRRLSDGSADHKAIAEGAAGLIGDTLTLLLGGGTTVLALARHLRPLPDRLIITPSPWVAIECIQRGHQVFVIGGQLSMSDGVNTGLRAQAATSDLAADIAVLGACGLDPDFGLSSDSFEDAELVRSMAACSAQVIVLADRTKVGRRARHRSLRPETLTHIVTDAPGHLTVGFAHHGTGIAHV